MSWPASGPWPADEVARLARDVRRGLTARPRWLPPKYFYDAAGAALFDRITALPEYYLTRTEEAILAEVAATVVRRVEPAEIAELGPGSCRKVRGFLDAVDHGGAVRYLPFDVDSAGLERALAVLVRDYPALDVRPIAGDFEHDLDRLPPAKGRRLLLFLGSTIGNFDPPACRRLLGELSRCLGPDGRLLLGVDLVKDRTVLEAAYNDAAGVTAAFNRNILSVINRGDCKSQECDRSFFNLDVIGGYAFWKEEYEIAGVGAFRDEYTRRGLRVGLQSSAGRGRVAMLTRIVMIRQVVQATIAVQKVCASSLG